MGASNSSLNEVSPFIDTSANPSDMDVDSKWCKLIVDGYLRLKDKKWEINLPKGINVIILAFYDTTDIIRYFTHYNQKKYKVSKNKTYITPTAGKSEYKDNYMIYPSPNGFRKGIHKWSVRKTQNNGQIQYAASIGVIKAMNPEWISTSFEDVWPTNDHKGVYDGWCDWLVGQTYTIVLNMDEGTVKIYLRSDDDDRIQDQYKLPDTDGPYYFAMAIDCCKRCSEFECVMPTC